MTTETSFATPTIARVLAARLHDGHPAHAAAGRRAAKGRRLAALRDACKYGGFGKWKAYDLIHAGAIDAYKMGRRTMIDLNSIDRYHGTLPKIVPPRPS